MLNFVDFIDGLGSRIVDPSSLCGLDNGHVFFMDESNELATGIIGYLGVGFTH